MSRDEFRATINRINNDAYIREWLIYVHVGNNFNWLCCLSAAAALPTCGVSAIIGDQKDKKRTNNMLSSVGNILQGANSKNTNCTWSLVRPSCAVHTWYIRIDTI